MTGGGCQSRPKSGGCAMEFPLLDLAGSTASAAAHILFHVHGGPEEALPVLFRTLWNLPSLWFIRRTLWHASVFTLPAIFAKASMWQLSADSGAPWVCLQRWQRCRWHQLETILLQFGSLQMAAEPLACGPCCKVPPEREWVCRS